MTCFCKVRVNHFDLSDISTSFQINKSLLGLRLEAFVGVFFIYVFFYEKQSEFATIKRLKVQKRKKK